MRGDGSRRLTYEEKVASDMEFARQRLDMLRERYDRRTQLLGEWCLLLTPASCLPAIIVAPCCTVALVRLDLPPPCTDWECS